MERLNRTCPYCGNTGWVKHGAPYISIGTHMTQIWDCTECGNQAHIPIGMGHPELIVEPDDTDELDSPNQSVLQLG